MTRALIVITGMGSREKAKRWIERAPTGTRIEFKATKRTLPQNDKMWAMLTDVAAQATHAGRKFGTDEWKAIFLHALGRETQFVPSLDGATFLPLTNRSSDLSKSEMSDLIELMLAWGAERGIVWSGDAEKGESDVDPRELERAGEDA